MVKVCPTQHVSKMVKVAQSGCAIWPDSSSDAAVPGDDEVECACECVGEVTRAEAEAGRDAAGQAAAVEVDADEDA